MWSVALIYNFECCWSIDNKLSDNNLASELVENKSSLNPHNRENCNFYDYSSYHAQPHLIIACW